MYGNKVNIITLKCVLVKDDMVLTAKEYHYEPLVFNSYPQACGVCPDGYHVREVIFRGSIDV